MTSSIVMTPRSTPSAVDDGHDVEVVLRHPPRDLLLVRLRRDADDLRAEDLPELLRRATRAGGRAAGRSLRAGPSGSRRRCRSARRDPRRACGRRALRRRR